MRLTITSLLFFLFAFSCVGQDSVLKRYRTKDSYLKSSKDQRTGGFVLCASGLAGLISTAVVDGGRRASGVFVTLLSLGTYEPEYKSYTGAYIISAACFAGGIYLYSASSKNRRKAKAASITIGLENADVLRFKAIYEISYPAIGIHIKI